VILTRVTIGRVSIVGAGAVVNSDIPPLSIAAGVPARIVRGRDQIGQ
jgi:acetyltransferase-like isoleucine patch superfamily enzyme